MNIEHRIEVIEIHLQHISERLDHIECVATAPKPLRFLYLRRLWAKVRRLLKIKRIVRMG